VLNLPPSVRIFVCTKPVDMRFAFDKLAMLAETVIKEDPFSGHLFVFFNKRRDRVKILFWDRTGMVLYYKRLEAGTFRIPQSESAGMEMTSSRLLLILEGIDLDKYRQRKRYVRPAKKH